MSFLFHSIWINFALYPIRANASVAISTSIPENFPSPSVKKNGLYSSLPITISSRASILSSGVSLLSQPEQNKTATEKNEAKNAHAILKSSFFILFYRISLLPSISLMSSATSVKHSIISGLKVPHSPLRIIFIAFSCGYASL